LSALALSGVARRWVRRAADAAGLLPVDDWELWGRAREGDAASARRLVQLLTPGALGLALQLLRRHEDAQDAVQEAFARLWRSRPSATQGARLSTYFNTIVINRCRSLRAARQREQATDPEEIVPMVDAPATQTAIAHPGLDAALARLPVRQRMAVVMWAWGEVDVAEIAAYLEVEPNAAHQLLHRARQALRRHLEEGGAQP